MPVEVRDYSNDRGQGIVDVVLKDRKEIYLTIGGETAFQTGYDLCDTCAYLFRKVVPAQKLSDGATEEVAHRLSSLLRDMRHIPDSSTLQEFGAILAPGMYSAALVRLTPELTMPGDSKDYFANEAVATWGLDPYFGVPESPRTPYYRLGTTDLGKVRYGGKLLGVALGVPLYPPTQEAMMSEEVIGQYRDALRDDRAQPTVFALGLADDRGPAVWKEPAPEYTRHLIVTLYILDGHHKVAAAAREHRPLQFLAFLPHDHLGRDWHEVVKGGVTFLERISG
jgi:hypothetical protein